MWCPVWNAIIISNIYSLFTELSAILKLGTNCVTIHLLHEPGHVMPCVANLTAEKSYVLQNVPRRMPEIHLKKLG
jgi:hypothetical protein